MLTYCRYFLDNRRSALLHHDNSYPIRGTVLQIRRTFILPIRKGYPVRQRDSKSAGKYYLAAGSGSINVAFLPVRGTDNVHHNNRDTIRASDVQVCKACTHALWCKDSSDKPIRG